MPHSFPIPFWGFIFLAFPGFPAVSSEMLFDVLLGFDRIVCYLFIPLFDFEAP